MATNRRAIASTARRRNFFTAQVVAAASVRSEAGERAGRASARRAAQLGQALAHAQARAQEPPLRSDVGQGLEDEGALLHARVRHDQVGLVDALVAVSQEVQVERARL